MSLVRQFADDNIDALVEARKIPVTPDNFTRGSSDIELEKYVTLAGGINRFYHFRVPVPVPVPVDNWPTIPMNRNTLCSAEVFNTSQRATRAAIGRQRPL